MAHKRSVSYIAVLLTLLASPFAHAFYDGFTSAKKIEGKNTVLYCQSGVEPSALGRNFAVTVSDRILAGRPAESGLTTEQALADMLDILYVRVCDITDMKLYSLKVNVKICRNHGELKGIYGTLFNSDLGGRQSFYVRDLNTIYVSQDSFTREIIGHEMAHAVISHYFVTDPPVKIQEILAMYVEYQLRER
jgi:hypothetical protein